MTGVASSEEYLKIINTPVDPTVDFMVVCLINLQPEPAFGWNGIWFIDSSDGASFQCGLQSNAGTLYTNVCGNRDLGAVVSYDTWYKVIVSRSGTVWSMSIRGGDYSPSPTVLTRDYGTTVPTHPTSFYAGLWPNSGAIVSGCNMKIKSLCAAQHSPSSLENSFIEMMEGHNFPGDAP